MTAKKIQELLRVLTWRRSLNFLLLKVSYFVSAWLRRPLHLGLPMSLSYEPTTACNLGCTECPTGQKTLLRPKGLGDLRLFKQLMDEMSPFLFNVIFYFQGEPFLNPSLYQFVSYARYKKVFTLISTNGHFLTPANSARIVEAGLHKLIVSVDGPTQESYAQYRKGGDLGKVLNGIKNIQRAKEKQGKIFPQVEMQFLVFRTNEHLIPDMKRLAKSFHVKLMLKSAQIYDYEQAHDLVPSLAKYSRYRLNSKGKYEIKSKLQNRCWRMWGAAVVTWDGRVLPCCFDKDAEHEQGKFGNATFSSVWKNDMYNDFRQKILTSRSQIDMCRNCTEGLNMNS